MDKRNSILIILFILGLIMFDALQQRFYVNTFDLTPEPVLLSTLLKSHSIRWMIWGILGIPFGMFVWSHLKKNGLRSRSLFLLLPVTLVTVAIAILSISFISIWIQKLTLSEALLELYVFYTFQKGLVFFMAYGMMVILLHNYLQTKRVITQEAEIISLTQTSEELIKSFKTKEEPILSIKTGNKVTPIALNEIIWIQADDYCVRIHTEHQSYTLRKSMKALEKQLSQFRFIRIHRGALLNLNYVEQINFESSTVRLQNERELPISRSGIKTLKNRIKESSL